MAKHLAHLAAALWRDPHILHEREQDGDDQSADPRELDAEEGEITWAEDGIPRLATWCDLGRHVARLDELKAHRLERLVARFRVEQVGEAVAFFDELVERRRRIRWCIGKRGVSGGCHIWRIWV